LSKTFQEEQRTHDNYIFAYRGLISTRTLFSYIQSSNFLSSGCSQHAKRQSKFGKCISGAFS